ncbi:hypothetical protein [Rhizobium tubonense]|uniref:hypothetical protein n=1 Tax=Rhizobium tubonense TaxID=484088 RepID=UPI0011B4E079|nr:hypothetical protein [Rhizobium tubonense]
MTKSLVHGKCEWPESEVEDSTADRQLRNGVMNFATSRGPGIDHNPTIVDLINALFSGLQALRQKVASVSLGDKAHE